VWYPLNYISTCDTHWIIYLRVIPTELYIYVWYPLNYISTCDTYWIIYLRVIPTELYIYVWYPLNYISTFFPCIIEPGAIIKKKHVFIECSTQYIKEVHSLLSKQTLLVDLKYANSHRPQTYPINPFHDTLMKVIYTVQTKYRLQNTFNPYFIAYITA
jgi:hypothetical protein